MLKRIAKLRNVLRLFHDYVDAALHETLQTMWMWTAWRAATRSDEDRTSICTRSDTDRLYTCIYSSGIFNSSGLII